MSVSINEVGKQIYLLFMSNHQATQEKERQGLETQGRGESFALHLVFWVSLAFVVKILGEDTIGFLYGHEGSDETSASVKVAILSLLLN